MRLWLSLALALSLAAHAAHAQEPSARAPQLSSAAVRVAVIVESEQETTAQRLRESLAKRSGAQIVDVDEAMDERSRIPRVLLAVSRGKRETVGVLYWDSTGRVDGLSAPITPSQGEFELVASALAAALLHRNLPRLATEQGDEPGCVTCEIHRLVADLRAHTISMPLVRRRTFPITLEDF